MRAKSYVGQAVLVLASRLRPQEKYLPSGDREELRLFIRHLPGEESAFSRTRTACPT